MSFSPQIAREFCHACGVVWLPVAIAATILSNRAASAAESSATTHVQAEVPRPVLAERLLDNLVCLCGRCARMSLSKCTCPVAATERQFVLDALKSRDVSTPEKEDEAYSFLVAAYRARHGGARVLATEGAHTSRQEEEWLFPAEVAVTIAGASLLIAAAELIRRRSERSRARESSHGRRRQHSRERTR